MNREETEHIQNKKFTEDDEREIMELLRNSAVVHNIIMTYSMPIRKDMDYIRRSLENIHERISNIEEKLEEKL